MVKGCDCMLFVRLAQLLASKRLKIADVCKDTNISRPTLTALYYGTSKGINFDTINKLCSYFHCQTNDLLYFYDVEIDTIEITKFNRNVMPNEKGNWPTGFYALIMERPLFEGEVRFKSSSFALNRVKFDLRCYVDDSDDNFEDGKEPAMYGTGTPVISFDLNDDVPFPYLPEDLRDYFGTTVLDSVIKEISKNHPNLFPNASRTYGMKFATK